MKKGFTLIELLAVIAILAVLVVIVVPNVISNYNSSMVKKMTIEESNIADAAEVYVEEHCTDPLYYNGKKYTCPETYTLSKYVCLSELQDPNINNGNDTEDYYVGDVKFKGEACNGVVVFDGVNKKTYLFCGAKVNGEFPYATDMVVYNTYNGNCNIN